MYHQCMALIAEAAAWYYCSTTLPDYDYWECELHWHRATVRKEAARALLGPSYNYDWWCIVTT